MKEENFTLTLENEESPILITVPHGGMKNNYGSWLNLFFKPRTTSEIKENNFIKGEKVVTGGDGQILHIVSDILKGYRANAVIGLLPRCFVDYNRFVPEVAYADETVKPFYDAYHQAIGRLIEKLLVRHPVVTLFDFHGFGTQPLPDKEFDVILGTNAESSPNQIDRFFYESLKEKYQIFSAGMDGLPRESDLYKGDTTNLHYHRKYGIDGLLVEIAPRFRSRKQPDSKENGQKLAADLTAFFQTLDLKLKK